MPQRLLLVVLLLLAVGATPAAAAVRSGTILINRGVVVDGGREITLGMTDAQVRRLLGRPVFANAAGFRQYGDERANVLFDLYLRGGRVDLIGISGRRFCLRGGAPCLHRRGGAAALRRRLGPNLRRVDAPDGTHYVVSGRFRGRRARTMFDLSTGVYRPAAQILMIFVGRG